jgi:Fe-S cluster assembly ATP-binding protein
MSQESEVRRQTSEKLLEISDLRVSLGDKEILRGINLSIDAGKVHAMMGPNGSGKSTLSYILAGREGYTVTQGEVLLNGVDLLAMKPEERAVAGLFLGFQYPVEIPGVSTMNFLKSCVNAVRKSRGLEEHDAVKFLRLVREQAKKIGVSEELLKRSLNTGFSGGEKKRAEILQMMMLEPTFAVLDETDSGLDIDALKTVADGVNSLRAPERGMLVITHYQRLLTYIVPDVIHVLVNGRIEETGGKELAEKLERTGYASYVKAA